MAAKYAKWPQNIPTSFLQVPPEFTQIRIFGPKMCTSGSPALGFLGWETFFVYSPIVAVIDVLSAQGLVGILSVGFCLHRFQAASADYRELLRWIVITDRI
jgi:hypothetical protein